MLKTAITKSPAVVSRQAVRALSAVSTASMIPLDHPGDDPLDLMRYDCIRHNLCDEAGFRNNNVHWTFSLAVSPPDSKSPPNLRTVGFQRVSTLGIDFVIKKGSPSSEALLAGQPVSFVAVHGRYVEGEHAEQWRGEGRCEELPLYEILGVVPLSTLTNIVACKRIQDEKERRGKDRVSMESASHLTDLVQQARLQLDIETLTEHDLADSVMAFRFLPDRVERMSGGPDSVTWDRWEWQREEGPWDEPRWLLPH